MSERVQKKIRSGFNGDSTAAEVMADVDLAGKVAVVTGGYSGIGLETTRALVEAGATVHVPARSMDSARAGLTGLPGVHLGTMDLADLDSVRAYANSVLAREPSSARRCSATCRMRIYTPWAGKTKAAKSPSGCSRCTRHLPRVARCKLTVNRK